MSQELSQLSETPPLPGAVAIPNINKIIQTIATDFAGPDDPAGMSWPYCTWADTGNNLKKRRNAAGTAWVVEGELFQQTARRNGDLTQDFSAKNISASSINGGQLAGFRNKILNGRFNINQAGAASRTAAIGYNYDQWYWDGTYLYQPVPTEDIENGTYTLSWEGNSTAAWSLNATGSSGQGSQTYTPVAKGGQIVVSGKTNQHLWVRFATDLANLNKVQLDPGSVATPYEERFYRQELALCQWFYEQSYDQGVQPGTPNANAGKQLFGTNLTAGTVDLVVFNVRLSPKRITPTVTVWSPTSGNAGRVRNESVGGDDTDIEVLSSTSGFSLQAYPLTASAALRVSFQWAASARI